jgi:RNA polymerase sigma-70 factor (ECF subfamily)
MYGDDLQRVCFIVLGNREMAEDALQDSYIKAYQNYSKFQGYCSEKTWLTRIVVNTCRNYRRTAWFKIRRRQVTLENITDAAYRWNAPDESLAAAILSLPHSSREAVLLRYYQGFSIEEASSILKISASTLYSRLAVARKQLRRFLQDVES